MNSGSAAAWLVAIVVIAHAWLLWHRLLAYLRYFQQEGYEHLRFLRWVGARPLGDPAVWLSLFAAVLAPASEFWAALGFMAGVAVLVRLQPDPRRSGKIPLRLTWRAVRVLGMSALLAAVLAFLWVSDVSGTLLGSAVMFALVPILLILANAVLAGYEHSIQQGFEADAVRRVKDVNPIIFGITGSYGKSSTKAILAHILQFKAPTLAATGSINTLMGVTRHIREDLVFGHRFMVVEMGAFKRGSIRRLCQLTPPSAAIITAVGDMHLERFGSTDAIVRAKSELAEALPSGGLLAVNADSPGALRIARSATHARVLLYGETSKEPLVTRLERVSFGRTGTTFVLRTRIGSGGSTDGEERVYECFTPLFGRPIILNLAGAFTMAAALGVDPAVIVAALRTLRPVSNRLEVVEERGVTWVRDAYNSNQFGFRAALEVVNALPVSRRFLATPGVIELGAEQFAVNRALSREAAAVCDRTIVVTDTNREAFVAGHKDAGREERLLPVASRRDAFAWLREHAKEGDAIVLENDLPDLYERAEGVFWTSRAKPEARA